MRHHTHALQKEWPSADADSHSPKLIKCPSVVFSVACIITSVHKFPPKLHIMQILSQLFSLLFSDFCEYRIFCYPIG